MKSNLKNNEKLLREIGEVRDDLIPDLKEKGPNRALKITLSAMCGLCAAFAVVGVGMKIYSRIHDNIPTQPGTSVTAETTAPRKDVSESSIWAGYSAAAHTPEKTGTENISLYLKGFHNAVSASDGDRYYGLGADVSGRSTLPVFRNYGRTENENGVRSAARLSEAETKALAQRASELLGLPDVSVDSDYYDEAKTVFYRCIMNSDDAQVTVTRDGTVSVLLSEHVPDSAAQSDEALVSYFAEKYAALAGWEHADGYVKTIFSDDEIKICRLYEASDDPLQALLNDCYSGIEISIISGEHESRGSGLFAGMVKFSNLLMNGDYLGEYEMISAAEAKRSLTETDLRTIGAQDYPPIADELADGKIPSDRIAETELVYLYEDYEEFMAPFYRFWVDVTDLVKDDPYTQKTQADLVNGRHYIPFDVPAVRQTEQTTDDTADNKADRKLMWDGLTAASCKPEKAGTEKLTLSGKYFNNTIYVKEGEQLFGSKARSTEIGRSTLPVFRNLGVSKTDPSLSSVFLSEEQSLELLDRAAKLLQIPDAPVSRGYWDAEQKIPHSFFMKNNKIEDGEIMALRDGTVTADVQDLITGESKIEFAKQRYASLTGWADTEAYLSKTVDITFWGDNPYSVIHLYEASDDPLQALLNDSLCYIDARYAAEEKITSLTFSNPLIAAEYIGEYAVIPVEKVRQEFLSFDLHSAGAQDYPDIADYLEGGKVTADRIVKTELLYLYNAHEDYIAPYYRFWVRTTGLVPDLNDHCNPEVFQSARYEEYIPFDIPAVRTNG